MMTLVKLKDQREQAALDLKRLENERRKAEEDPQTFVSNFFSKREYLPRRQVAAHVPPIDFETYEKLPLVPGGVAKTEPAPKPKKASAAATSSTIPKASTQSAPWSLEEQHRLEQLLIEYPDEPVAAYRWEKIARALGRTPKQVVSRVHRYFERLARAGLPVPGRLPTSKKDSAKEGAQPRSSSVTTSAPSAAAPHTTRQYNWYEAPVVKMEAVMPVINDATLLTEEEKRAFAGLESSAEYKELIRLKRFKKFQEQSHERYVSTANPTDTQSSTVSTAEQHNLPRPTQSAYSCSSCHTTSSTGRWYRCITCTHQKISLCSNCHDQRLFKTEEHSPTHMFDVEQSVQFVDADYALADDMAYLDPNYMGN